ncbi:fluoride efflux transporter CrcB [Desulfoferrobacter suflitae]|uniref:fluoride efflux transporter CrcB n=1 Tax=Desulfoferrobacter suflitae TaxID=2865782 RepID=UPI0021640969|nr:fluoride efflux transporter CrcB [Desulfoferrobacter suflitae]MCK8601612.1 fluoride efflux transporter CrcB [Desulfoferrobacter suflitae]
MLTKIALVMIGGSLGALCRYGMGLMAAGLWGAGFPWGTLMANLTGCFLIGVSFALAERTSLLGPAARLFFMTGFLGALTTFSTYALETVNSIRSEAPIVALTNVAVNNVTGILLVLAGIWLVRFLRP